MGLLTQSTNTGIGTATGYTGLEGATDFYWRLRTQGSSIINPGAGGSQILALGNGSNFKFELWIYQDGANRYIQVIYRDGGGQRYSELGYATASLTSGAYYVLSGYYSTTNAGQHDAFLHDSSNTQLAAAGVQETEGTMVTTGYTTLTVPRSGANKVHDGLAFWNANPGGSVNDEPTDTGSILGYYAFDGNGDNEVAGAPALSLGGSSPTDYSFSAGGDWDPWSAPPAGSAPVYVHHLKTMMGV